MSLESEFGFIADWSLSQFPDQTIRGAGDKIIEEFDEWFECDPGSPNELNELADLFITIIGYAARAHSLIHLDHAIRGKMRINMARTWATDDNGKGQHVE